MRKFGVYKDILGDLFQGAVKKGFFHLFSANVFIYLFSFASQFFVAGFLTVEQLGQIRILQTYLSFAVLFSVFGFNTSVVKLCSENRGVGEVRYLFRKALGYVAITSIVACVIVASLNCFNLISSDKEIKYYFYILIISVIPQAFDNLFTSYLQARRLIKEYSKINVVVKLISVSGVILCTWQLGMPGYIAMYIGGFFISFIVLASYIKRHSQEEIVPVEKPFKLHFNLAYIALITNLLGQIFSYFDIFLMNYLVSDREAIGYYSFAITLTLGMTIYRNTVSQIVVPYLSNVSGNSAVLLQRTKNYGKLNIYASLFIAIAFILSVPFLVKIVYAGKFDNSMVFFFILCISEMFYSINSFKGYSILAIGEIKYNLYESIIRGVISLLLAVIGLYLYGLIGLALSRLITNALEIIIVNCFYKLALVHYSKKDPTRINSAN